MYFIFRKDLFTPYGANAAKVYLCHAAYSTDTGGLYLHCKNNLLEEHEHTLGDSSSLR